MTQQDSPGQFKNEHIDLTVEHKPACRVEFHVKAKPSLVKSAHILAVKSVCKETTMPGFRKGKAPHELIIKKLPAQVDQKWQEAIANMAFQECETLCQIFPLQKDTRVTFKTHRHSLDQGAELILFFETHPQVPQINPKEFELKPVEKPEVNEQKIQETIRQVQLFFSEWKKIENRPVQEGDFVLLDVDILEEEPPKKLFSNTRFEVTKNSMAQWMRDAILGQNKGENIEAISIPDDDVKTADEEAFKPKKVRVFIKEIEEPTIPEVNDSFAKKLGVNTTKELYESIENLLNDQANAHVKEKMREQVDEFLLSHYKFDLPMSMIEKEARFRMNQLLDDEQFQTYWNSLNNEERKKIAQQIYQQSEKAVRMFHLCSQLINLANLSVDPQDLPHPPKTPLEALLRPQSSFHFQNESEVKQAEAYSRMLMQKAQDFMIANGRTAESTSQQSS